MLSQLRAILTILNSLLIDSEAQLYLVLKPNFHCVHLPRIVIIFLFSHYDPVIISVDRFWLRPGIAFLHVCRFSRWVVCEYSYFGAVSRSQGTTVRTGYCRI